LELNYEKHHLTGVHGTRKIDGKVSSPQLKELCGQRDIGERRVPEIFEKE